MALHHLAGTSPCADINEETRVLSTFIGFNERLKIQTLQNLDQWQAGVIKNKPRALNIIQVGMLMLAQYDLENSRRR